MSGCTNRDVRRALSWLEAIEDAEDALWQAKSGLKTIDARVVEIAHHWIETTDGSVGEAMNKVQNLNPADDAVDPIEGSAREASENTKEMRA